MKLNFVWHTNALPYDFYCRCCETERAVKRQEKYAEIKLGHEPLLNLCANCVNDLWPHIKEFFDPTLRFYE